MKKKAFKKWRFYHAATTLSAQTAAASPAAVCASLLFFRRQISASAPSGIDFFFADSGGSVRFWHPSAAVFSDFMRRIPLRIG
jgi:hypothetical protein